MPPNDLIERVEALQALLREASSYKLTLEEKQVLAALAETLRLLLDRREPQPRTPFFT